MLLQKCKRVYIALLVLFFAGAAMAQELPPKSNPPTLVNDYAGVLTEAQRQNLESKLVAFDDSTSTQIAIVLIKSTGIYPVDDYAIALYRDWGIGRKGKDNGALILAAMEDRRMTIITGYGLEGSLPDAICKRIIELTIKPAFKQQEYYQGLDAATTEMMKRTQGEYQADNERTQTSDNFLLTIIIVLAILFFVFMTKVISVRRYAALNKIGFWQAWMLLNAAANADRSRRGSNWGGGMWGGGSWGGGSSSGGGGFGGFGGGSTGGGGATGGW